MCIIPYRVVVTVSRCQWYLSTFRPKYKSIAVVDAYEAILQISTQIETLPEVMLAFTVVARWNILLRLYRRWTWWRLDDFFTVRRSRSLIGPRVGLWTVLLVRYLTVRQRSLLTVHGLHEMVSTD
jgi:hypothetical protein